jgi:predicted Zn finger-like uncharacterized protein
MIIQCPACATRYVVPDGAIGADGRTVRCAKCRHNWFQDGPELVVPPPAPAAPPFIPAPEPEPVPERAPEPEPEPAPLSPFNRTTAPPPELPDHSPFDAEPPFRARRNWLKVWTWAAAIFAVFAAAIIVAVSYWGLPDWVPVNRPDFALEEPDLQLDFPDDQQVKRETPGGQEYFAVNGTITNIGSTARRVPPILVVLRDARERNVWQAEIVPEQSTLAPGESLNINRAMVDDIPRAARVAEIGWKAE